MAAEYNPNIPQGWLIPVKQLRLVETEKRKFVDYMIAFINKGIKDPQAFIGDLIFNFNRIQKDILTFISSIDIAIKNFDRIDAEPKDVEFIQTILMKEGAILKNLDNDLFLIRENNQQYADLNNEIPSSKKAELKAYLNAYAKQLNDLKGKVDTERSLILLKLAGMAKKKQRAA